MLTYLPGCFYLSHMDQSIEHLQYPVGRFSFPDQLSQSEIDEAISIIASFPAQLREAYTKLTPELLETPYRPEGWTKRQVIHHCADSHMNAIIRFKLALTEDKPRITAYAQAAWANMPDIQLNPEVSLSILEGIHQRWVAVLETLPGEAWQREFLHPEFEKPVRLFQALAMYAWHCRHHLAHVMSRP